MDDHDVNSVSEPSSTKFKNHSPSRRRLNYAGVRILEEYWSQNPGTLPSIGVRHGLTDKIKNIPGNDFYKMVNTTDWFKRRIAKVQAQSTSNPQFPSLTKAALEHLEVLLKNQPNPPSDVIHTWAALLSAQGVTYQDVVNWVNTTGHNNGTNTRLPTPTNTASPEHSPSLPPSSPVGNHAPNIMKRDPMRSPMLPPLAIPTTNQLDGLVVHSQGSRYSPFTPISATSSTSTAPPITPASPAGTIHTWQPPQQQQQQQQQQLKRPHVPILQAIIRGVADAVSTTNLPAAAVPSSAAEFNEMFAPYEKQMVQLMHALEHS
ncbi:hypothetical protein CVT25_005112 [Psilocybe cyanescens]|uniref:Uncharacterized protein n=1 Tax=Psilocybe cyanescens TaxID=93625 RepID=A0A409XE04_PSICY|nr:hypothetical protein CVT25_005112 [Psilocybe cyanescens]